MLTDVIQAGLKPVALFVEVVFGPGLLVAVLGVSMGAGEYLVVEIKLSLV